MPCQGVGIKMLYRVILICLSLLMLLPNLVVKDINPLLSYDGKEKFDTRLAYINSVAKLQQCIDSAAVNAGIHPKSFEYIQLVEEVIEQRFYHGFSHYSLHENWLAALAGRWLKEDYACKVDPESILQHSNAACSQQALVMMQVLRNNHISYRKLGFPHHYALEAKMEGDWYFFDANMEPGITRQQRKMSSWQHHNDQLKQYYDANRHKQLNYQFGMGQQAVAGIINEVPARRAAFFHTITSIVSKCLWCLPLLLLYLQPVIRIKRLRWSFAFLLRKSRRVAIPV
jgi:hypothetical protein